MGLLKGSQVRFTQADAIIGDDVITPVDLVESEELRSVVPQQAAPSAAPAPVAAPVESVVEAAPLEPVEDEPDVEESFAAEGPLAEYDEIRNHLLLSAEEKAGLDADQVTGQLQQGEEGFEEHRLSEARTALAEANPDADFDDLAPSIRRHATADWDLELVGTVNEIRWTHLQRIESKIVGEVEGVAHDLEDRHLPETFQELLAHRERILSEARLVAQRQILEAETRAAALTADAERHHAEMLTELSAERERIMAELREQAREDGYNEGKAAGEAEAATYLQEALQKLNEIAISFPAAVKQNEEKIITLALEIARKVIQQEIALQPEVVQRTVETALRRVSDLDQVIIKVNPLDLDLILPKQDTFKAIIPDVQNFAIEGSHTIQRGGCVIETSSGSINASIETQLSIVDELFKKVQGEYEDEVLGEIT